MRRLLGPRRPPRGSDPARRAPRTASARRRALRRRRRPWTLHPQVALRPESFGALAYHFGTRRLSFLKSRTLLAVVESLADQPSGREACRAAGVAPDELGRLRAGARHPGRLRDDLRAGGRDRRSPADRADPPAGDPAGRPVRARARRPDLPDLGAHLRLQPGLRALPVELGPAGPAASSPPTECRALIDEFERMQIFYVNIGGGEPTIRSDFWDLVDYATEHHVGVKFSTNGSRITGDGGARGWRPATTSTCRSPSTGPPPRSTTRSGARAPSPPRVTAMERLAAAGFTGFKLSVVVTRHNVRPARRLQGPRRPLRGPAPPHPPAAVRPGRRRLGRAPPDRRSSSAPLYDWLVDHGRGGADRRLLLPSGRLRRALPGLNLCGAGRVVCLIDPVGDVYACPFAIHDEFLAGNVRAAGRVRRRCGGSRSSSLELREPAERGGLRLVRPLRRLPGRVHGRQVLHRPAARRSRPRVRPRPRRARPRRSAATPRRPGPRPTTRARPRRVAVALTRPRTSGRRRPAARTAPATRPAGRLRARPRAADRGTRSPTRSPGGRRRAPVAGGLRPARDQPRPPAASIGDRHVAYYAARAAGRRRGGGHRDGLGPPLRLALRAGPAGRRRADRAGGRWPTPAGPTGRWCWPGSATPAARGRAPTRSRCCGPRRRWPTWSAARCPWRWAAAEIDALVDGFAAAARLAVASGLDGVEVDAGPLLAAAPVPLRAHQPARRRLRAGPAAADPRGARRGAGRRRARTAGRPAAVAATSWPRGPG